MKMKYDTGTTRGKIEVMQAYLDSGEFPYGRRRGVPANWVRLDEWWWDWRTNDYNYPAEPEPPKLVPWTFETCPKERMWLCPQSVVANLMELVTRISFNAVFASDWQQPKTFSDLFKNYTHSLDNGRTWLPCGTEEKR